MKLAELVTELTEIDEEHGGYELPAGQLKEMVSALIDEIASEYSDKPFAYPEHDATTDE